MVNTSPGYFLDRTYLAEFFGLRFLRLQDATARLPELRHWCDAGVRYAVFDRSPSNLAANIEPLQTFAWIRVPGLRPTVLFSANGVDVLSINPCDIGSTRTRTRISFPK